MYIKPEIQITKFETPSIMCSSNEDQVEQCDCYEFNINGGCKGCKGGCGCNYWDGEELIPGC